MEVTNSFIQFEWVWSGMPKVIENNELIISQKWTWYDFFFFFLMWLGMHKYVSTIKSIHLCFVKREMTRTHQELIRIY